MNCERADRVVRRFALVTLVLPVVVTTVGLMVQLAVLPQAPAADPDVLGRFGRAERLGTCVAAAGPHCRSRFRAARGLRPELAAELAARRP